MDYKTAVLAGMAFAPMQAFWEWFRNHATQACVNGTALLGLHNGDVASLGDIDRESAGRILRESFPSLSLPATCPVCPKRFGDATVLSVTVHLNDVHRWKRERIAAWVDSF